MTGTPPSTILASATDSVTITRTEFESLQHKLQELERQQRQQTVSLTTEPSDPAATLPKIPAPNTIVFDPLDKLKGSETFAHWDHALCMLLPPPVSTYLRKGTFDHAWSTDMLRSSWQHYAGTILYTSVDPSIRSILSQTDETPHDSYKCLAARFAPRNAQAFAKLIQNYWNMPPIPLTSREEFDSHLDATTALANQLRLGNVSLEDVLVAACLFHQLPDGLSTWRTAYLQRHKNAKHLPSLDEMFKSMRTEAHTLIDGHTTALLSKSKTPKFDFDGPPPSICPACNKGMHWLRDCPDKEAKEKYKKKRWGRFHGNRDKGNAQAHLAVVSQSSPTSPTSTSATTLAAYCFLSSADLKGIIVDSAASNHMFKDKDIFNSLSPSSIGIGGSISSKGTGTVTITSNPGKSLQPSNVLLAPDSPANLVSTFALNDDGIDVLFSKGRVSLLQDGQVICSGKAKTDHLYRGRRYLLTFINDFSRKAWAFPLARKSDALITFKQWKAQVENQSGSRIKTLRSDNGGAYTAFDKFCAEEGIHRDKSVPYTPEQNGRAEHLNRSIVEGILALLHDSGLPSTLWEEATQYYLTSKNLTPHSGIGGDVPDTVWHGSVIAHIIS